MADTRLKHRTSRIDSRLYFYDGSKPIKAGVITIPHGRREWAGHAYLKGYVLDPDTGRELSPAEVQRRVSSVVNTETVSDISTAPDPAVAPVKKVAKPKVKRKKKTSK